MTTQVLDGRSRISLRSRMLRLVRNRELLVNLVRKELRGRYKDSMLGFVWSLLNPIMYVLIFYIVFGLILPSGIPSYPAFVLAGLLPWTLFASGLTSGTASVVLNGPLLKKVAFAREVLPLASVGAALFHFCLQMLVLLAYLLLIDAPFLSGNLVLVPVAIFVEILMLAGLTLLLSSVNVYLRDVQHFLDLAILAWFWMTPVLYQITLVADRAKDKFWVYLVNPMAPVVLAFQRAFYNMTAPVGKDGTPVPVLLDVGMGWYLRRLGWTALVGAILFVVGLAVFARNEGNFAEEL
ncbi:MAG: ABC transporter permease [Actinomycetota bacterium]